MKKIINIALIAGVIYGAYYIGNTKGCINKKGDAKDTTTTTGILDTNIRIIAKDSIAKDTTKTVNDTLK